MLWASNDAGPNASAWFLQLLNAHCCRQSLPRGSPMPWRSHLQIPVCWRTPNDTPPYLPSALQLVQGILRTWFIKMNGEKKTSPQKDTCPQLDTRHHLGPSVWWEWSKGGLKGGNSGDERKQKGEVCMILHLLCVNISAARTKHRMLVPTSPTQISVPPYRGVWDLLLNGAQWGHAKRENPPACSQQNDKLSNR